jgi:hypothetical protein
MKGALVRFTAKVARHPTTRALASSSWILVTPTVPGVQTAVLNSLFYHPLQSRHTRLPGFH